MLNYFIKSPENKEEWEEYLLFRWKMLRKPLGMSKESLEDELEDNSFHLTAVNKKNNNIIGSGRVHFNSKEEAQIRYMAVSENFKRKGIGSEIVKRLEEYALNNGAKTLILNARKEAINFYKSLDYLEGSPYQSDTGIPHKTMKKSLS
jgi:N-acetylglutamate synthase-like GNAT family acetyltransferase